LCVVVVAVAAVLLVPSGLTLVTMHPASMNSSIVDIVIRAKYLEICTKNSSLAL